MPKPKAAPKRKHYPPKKQTIGVLVSADLRQRIRDYGASIRDDDGPVPESTAARMLISMGLQIWEENKP